MLKLKPAFQEYQEDGRDITAPEGMIRLENGDFAYPNWVMVKGENGREVGVHLATHSFYTYYDFDELTFEDVLALEDKWIVHFWVTLGRWHGEAHLRVAYRDDEKSQERWAELMKDVRGAVDPEAVRKWVKWHQESNRWLTWFYVWRDAMNDARQRLGWSHEETQFYRQKSSSCWETHVLLCDANEELTAKIWKRPFWVEKKQPKPKKDPQKMFDYWQRKINHAIYLLGRAEGRKEKAEAAYLNYRSPGDEVGEHFHLGMVGGSGREVKKLNKRKMDSLDKLIRISAEYNDACARVDNLQSRVARYEGYQNNWKAKLQKEIHTQ